MKILYVTTVSPTLGFLKSHINSLLDKGHKVDIACNVIGKVDSKLSAKGCTVYQVDFERSPLSLNNLKSISQLRRVIKEGGYEIVHTHTPIASFIARLVCRKFTHIKVVYTAHGFHFYKGAKLKNWLTYYPLEKLASNWSTAIITMNEEDYQLARQKLSKNARVFKINGVGIDFKKLEVNTEKEGLRERYELDKEDFILFYAAELNVNKHQDLLINGVEKLKNEIPNIKLLLAGSGPLNEKYKLMVKDLKLDKNVKFLGFTKEVPSYLQISDVAVASSRREGLPVNILEAMAMGSPIVATDVRGHRDLIKNNKNGFLVKNEESFIEAISKLYYDYNLREKFSRYNEKIIKQYSNEEVHRQLHKIYTDLKS